MTPAQLEGIRLMAARGALDVEISAALGVHPRTVSRARARFGIPAGNRRPGPRPIGCGTPGQYNRGCRCRACSAAKVASNRASRRRMAYAAWATMPP